MATTLKDIAAAAGVSIGTVDRALNNRKRINPQVAEHIRQLAKEMNYQPNRVASGLVRKNRNYKIAVIFHTKENDFWRVVIQGIHKAEREIKDYGIAVQLYFGRNFNAEIQLSLINQAIADGASAMVIVPIDSPLIARRVRELRKEQFPVVFLNTFINRMPVLSSIHCDYYRTGRIAGMLINRFSRGCGHAIAFLPSSMMRGNNERSSGIQDYFNSAPATLVLDKIVQLHNDEEADTELIVKELNEHKEAQYVIYNGDAHTCLSAIERVNRQMMSVFFDLSEDARNALINGQIDAVITQGETDQGYRAINTLFQYLAFDIIPKKEVLMESTIVFKECID